jgi:hypothetical protein
MENEQQPNVLESLFERTNDYLETRIELAKLKAIRKSSEVASSVASKILLGVVFCFFLMVFNIGLGLWIGELLGKAYWGFFTLAGFYLIVGLIIYAGRDKLLKAPVANSIIKKITG